MKNFFHSEEKEFKNILNVVYEMGIVFSDTDEFIDEEAEEVIFYEVE